VELENRAQELGDGEHILGVTDRLQDVTPELPAINCGTPDVALYFFLYLNVTG